MTNLSLIDCDIRCTKIVVPNSMPCLKRIPIFEWGMVECESVIGENRQLVIDEPVEFEK